MPRRFNRFHAHAAKFHACAICQWRKFVLSLSLRAQIDFRAELIAQLKMPRDKIGVQVRQKNVFDVEFVFRGKCEIDADVALRVDHGRLGRLLVPNQIRSMSQAAQIKLFEDHFRRSSLVINLLQNPECMSFRGTKRRGICFALGSYQTADPSVCSGPAPRHFFNELLALTSAASLREDMASAS